MIRCWLVLALILSGCGGPTMPLIPSPTTTPAMLALPLPPEAGERMARLAIDNGKMRAVLNSCGQMIDRYQRDWEKERRTP